MLTLLVLMLVPTLSTQAPIHQKPNNGWIPIHFDQVYRQIRRHNDENYNIKAMEQIDKTWIPTKPVILLDLIYNAMHDPIKVIDPHETEGFNISKRFDENDGIKKRPSVENSEKKYKDLNSETNAVIVQRNGKKLDYKTRINKIEGRAFVEQEQLNKENGFLGNSKHNVVKKVEPYEVTESTLDNQAIQGKAFQINVSNNLNENLNKILLKYGIKNDDKLPNYKFSRRGNNLKYGYFSPNTNVHDFQKTMAVFLSSYGAYLPSMYGITGNYGNLYGNLAFNNIHNNKPFGPYKLISEIV